MIEVDATTNLVTQLGDAQEAVALIGGVVLSIYWLRRLAGFLALRSMRDR